jgi:hypothetical protein
MLVLTAAGALALADPLDGCTDRSTGAALYWECQDAVLKGELWTLGDGMTARPRSALEPGAEWTPGAAVRMTVFGKRTDAQRFDALIEGQALAMLYWFDGSNGQMMCVGPAADGARCSALIEAIATRSPRQDASSRLAVVVGAVNVVPDGCQGATGGVVTCADGSHLTTVKVDGITREVPPSLVLDRLTAPDRLAAVGPVQGRRYDCTLVGQPAECEEIVADGKIEVGAFSWIGDQPWYASCDVRGDACRVALGASR